MCDAVTQYCKLLRFFIFYKTRKPS